MLGEWITLVGSILGIVSLVFGGIMWFRGTVRKRYAAERDFNHLKKSFEQLSQNIAVIEREFTAQFNQLDDGQRELKASLEIIKTLQIEIKAMNYQCLRNGGMLDTQ